MYSIRTVCVTVPKIAIMLGLLAAIGCRTDETPENQVKDARILADVKGKLAEGLGASTVTNISVNVTAGVVTLSGIVHNSTEQTKAEEIAKGVPNVVKVNDTLQVSSGGQGTS